MGELDRKCANLGPIIALIVIEKSDLFVHKVRLHIPFDLPTTVPPRPEILV